MLSTSLILYIIHSMGYVWRSSPPAPPPPLPSPFTVYRFKWNIFERKLSATGLSDVLPLTLALLSNQNINFVMFYL